MDSGKSLDRQSADVKFLVIENRFVQRRAFEFEYEYRFTEYECDEFTEFEYEEFTESGTMNQEDLDARTSVWCHIRTRNRSSNCAAFPSSSSADAHGCPRDQPNSSARNGAVRRGYLYG